MDPLYAMVADKHDAVLPWPPGRAQPEGWQSECRSVSAEGDLDRIKRTRTSAGPPPPPPN